VNSSVLVSGLVIIGFGAMAILFNPFGSSDTASNPTSTYQVSADSSKSSTPNLENVTSSDPEPFVWETKKKTVASTGILDEFSSSKTVKKVAKAKPAKKSESSFELGSGTKSSETSTPKQQTVSKTNSNFGDQTASTVDSDLNSFFGSSKPKKKTANKVAKAPEAKPAITRVKSEPVAKPEPVRVASKPATDSAKSTSPWPTQEVKSAPKTDDMFTFAPGGGNDADDAPMLDPVKDFKAPKVEPAAVKKMASKTQSSKQEISGEFKTVLTDFENSKPPIVKEFNIKNPLSTRLTVTFLANGKKVSLKPGQKYNIRQPEFTVKFSRGGSFGYFEEKLSEGDYEFSVTRKEGWKLAQ